MDPIIPSLNINGLVVGKAIIQGGMGVGISLSGLASAVANAGGVGVISAVGIGQLRGQGWRNTDALREEIRRARAQMRRGALGLNIMVALSDYDELLTVGYQEAVDLVILGAGLPLRWPETIPLTQLRQGHTRTAVIVSSARAAQLIFSSWQKKFDHVPDMVVVEGPLAGGHLGFKREQIDDPAFRLEAIFPPVLEAVASFAERYGKAIPVIAAGGIFTGGDVRRFLDMGAAGVQMATRFVATHECDADIAFKQAYVDAKQGSLAIIQSPVGLPGRAIGNAFLDDVAAGEKKPFRCPWKCLKTCDIATSPYCIAQALIHAQKGRLAQGFAFAGANAWRVGGIVSVQELFETLENEYTHSLSKRVPRPLESVMG